MPPTRRTGSPILPSALWLLLTPALADAAPFTWTQGQPTPVAMTAKNDSVCVLTGVTGRFHGNGEQVRVVRGVTRWQLAGSSNQADVGAEAECVRLDRFTGKTPAMLVGEKAQAWSGAGGGSACVQNIVDVAPRTAAAYVSSFGGDYRGGGEFLQVAQSIDATPTRFVSQTCRENGQMFAGVTAFLPGTPHQGTLPLFRGRANPRGHADDTGEYVAGPNQAVPMARVAEGLCYFTRIAGGFHGGGESATIRAQNFAVTGPRWVLTTRAHSGDGVWASARCVLFDQ